MKSELRPRWEALVEKVIERRPQFDRFIAVLEEESTYFTAPASPKYHCNWAEGLLEHSINVAENAIKIKNVLMPEIKDESCVICGLFHDLGKGPIGEPYYLFNVPTPNQQRFGFVAYPRYIYNTNKSVFMTVPQRAVRQVSSYIPLTDEEYQAILIHDGMYVDENKAYGLKEVPLARILQYADNWSGLVIEGIDEKNEDGKGYHRVKRW